MAKRAYEHGADVLLGAELSNKMYELNFNSAIELSSPPEEMPDYHLVLDYLMNSTWGKIEAPRTNRFYLHHDIKNADFDEMANFH